MYRYTWLYRKPRTPNFMNHTPSDLSSQLIITLIRTLTETHKDSLWPIGYLQTLSLVLRPFTESTLNMLERSVLLSLAPIQKSNICFLHMCYIWRCLCSCTFYGQLVKTLPRSHFILDLKRKILKWEYNVTFLMSHPSKWQNMSTELKTSPKPTVRVDEVLYL